MISWSLGQRCRRCWVPWEGVGEVEIRQDVGGVGSKMPLRLDFQASVPTCRDWLSTSSWATSLITDPVPRCDRRVQISSLGDYLATIPKPLAPEIFPYKWDFQAWVPDQLDHAGCTWSRYFWMSRMTHLPGPAVVYLNCILPSGHSSQ